MIGIFLRNLVRDLLRQPLRTTLTLSGVVWGTFSVVLLIAFGDSVSKAQFKRFHGMGQGIVLMFPARTTLPWRGFLKGKPVRVTPEMVEAIPDKVPGIEVISPEFVGSRLISHGRKEFRNTVRGVNPGFERMRNTIAETGRFINPEDMAGRKRVCLIGDVLAQDLFDKLDVAGETIFIDKVPFTVIGILQKKLQDSMYQGPDADQIYVPFSSFLMIDNQPFLDRIHIQPREAGLSSLIDERVRVLLGRKYRFDPTDRYALGVWNTIEGAKEGQAIFKGIEIFLAIIGGLTLLIGAVGVTNLMYAVVKERTKEIGIKLAIGAKRKVIVQQFILETMFIFSQGTFWGFIAAFNLVHLIRLAPVNYDSFGIEAYLLRPVFSVRIFIAYVIVLGVLVFLSGIFPAWRASRSNPIESLRYE